MLRSLMITVSLAAGLVTLSACETIETDSGFTFDAQAADAPAVLPVSATPDRACERELRFDVLNAFADPTQAPLLVTRCIPMFPRRAMQAELTASCITIFTVDTAGAPNVQRTDCTVDGARRADWRAYGEAAFGQAASTALSLYRFDPDTTRRWTGQKFAVRTLFLFDDMAPPRLPTLPADVVEILKPNSQS